MATARPPGAEDRHILLSVAGILRKYLGAYPFPVDNDATTLMPPSPSGSIFVSYACDGAELAQRLQSDLSREGFDVWLDRRRLEGGGAWSLEIEQEIDAREITVALLTPGSYESALCRAEQVRPLRKGKRFIPILAASNAALPDFIDEREFGNFRDLVRYGENLQRLLAVIRGNDTAKLLERYRSDSGHLPNRSATRGTQHREARGTARIARCPVRRRPSSTRRSHRYVRHGRPWQYDARQGAG